jgi:hypothetical protein
VTGAGAACGRKPSGSRYPSGSAAARTPRWTCEAVVAASRLAPTTPTGAPSATASSRATAADASWSSVTAWPSAVWIVTARPPPGTKPTKETVPPTGATTAAPTSAPMSTPRCWPPAYGSDPSENGRSTGPATGHVQAAAAGAGTSASARVTETVSTRCIGTAFT